MTEKARWICAFCSSEILVQETMTHALTTARRYNKEMTAIHDAQTKNMEDMVNLLNDRIALLKHQNQLLLQRVEEMSKAEAEHAKTV